MLHLYLILAVLALALAVNVAALNAGGEGADWPHRCARASGALGIFLILCIPIALFFALGSWFVDLIGDASVFFFSALYGAAALTLLSCVLCVVVFRVDARSKT